MQSLFALIFATLSAVYLQTVVFDCCRSSFAVRRPVRYSGVYVPIYDFDRNINQCVRAIGRKDRLPRGSNIPPAFAHTGLHSHTIITSCGAQQLAWESDGHGVFTKVFLAELDAGLRKNTSYKELMKRIPGLPW